MNEFDLIIYDCDGTLTDSELINNQATLDVLANAGVHYTLDYALKNWVGNSLPGIMLAVQAETGVVLPEDIVAQYIRRVTELQKTGMKSIRGANELVAATKVKYQICVASNGERNNVLNSLEIVDLMQNFTDATVFTKIQVTNPKPAPDLFLFAADKMGVTPSRCLVIEDSAAGIRAGVAAGMTVFGFTGSSHEAEKHSTNLQSAGAHEVFHELIHIKRRLGL